VSPTLAAEDSAPSSPSVASHTASLVAADTRGRRRPSARPDTLARPPPRLCLVAPLSATPRAPPHQSVVGVPPLFRLVVPWSSAPLLPRAGLAPPRSRHTASGRFSRLCAIAPLPMARPLAPACLRQDGTVDPTALLGSGALPSGQLPSATLVAALVTTNAPLGAPSSTSFGLHPTPIMFGLTIVALTPFPAALRHPSRPPSIFVGNGSTLPVTSVGTSVLPGPFYLNDILVALGLTHPLLLVRRFTSDKHCSMEFDPWGLTIRHLPTRVMLLAATAPVPSTLFTCQLPSTPSTSVASPMLLLLPPPPPFGIVVLGTLDLT
jgi:hypothetical protein